MAQTGDLQADNAYLRERIVTLTNERQAQEASLLRLSLENERLRADLQEFRDWRDKLVAEAHAEATERRWCEEFDDWMTEHGLPGRERDWSVTVEFTMTGAYTVAVKAHNEQDAGEAAKKRLAVGWSDGSISVSDMHHLTITDTNVGDIEAE